MGFKDDTFDAVATHLDGTVTEESEIDTAVEGVETLLKAFQGHTDKRVADAVKAKTDDKKDDKKDEKGADKKDEPKSEDVPEWAKGLIDTNKALLAKVEALESGKTTDTRKTELEALLKDTPETFRNMKLKDFGRMAFKDDDEFNAYKTELSEGLEGMKDIFVGQQSSDSRIPPPVMVTKGKNGVSTVTQAYIDSKKAESKGQTPIVGKQIFTTE
ncbi:MAG TPA: hypothetical protein VGE24_07775 [Emticicia sp.]